MWHVQLMQLEIKRVMYRMSDMVEGYLCITVLQADAICYTAWLIAEITMLQRTADAGAQ